MRAELAKAWTSQPIFLTLNGRKLFALQVAPTGPCTGAVLYLPAFAEEMNRFRSHVSAHARALAALGFQSLLLDPFGTGESEGEIVDGNWQHWLDDAAAAGQWLIAQTGQPLTVWGARTGALLAAEVAAGGAVDVAGLLFWQPVLDGKQFMNQYLRLRIASQMVKDAERETSELIRARLAAGEALEVAGYPLTGMLADSLAARRLDGFPSIARQRIAWLDLVARPGQDFAPASRNLIDQLRAAGAQLHCETVACPLVWQLHERVDAPELLQASARLMKPLP